MSHDCQLPPSDRNDAPVPPPRPKPIAVTDDMRLALDAIGRAIATGHHELVCLQNALAANDTEGARAAAVALLAALKPDPRMLAFRIARTLKGEAP